MVNRSKKSNYKALEKKADTIFSQYIRLRDANEQGYVTCITCGRIHFWSEGHHINCGHFISRKRKAVRYNEMNCHGQCVACNKYGQGEHDIYRRQLVLRYGKVEVEALEQKAWLGGSLNSYGLIALIEEYKEKVKQLKKEKGL